MNHGVNSGVESDFGFVPKFIARDGSVHDTLFDAVERSRPVSLDFPAINTFLRSGIFMNGSTPFAGVRRFSPALVVVPPCEIGREAAMDAYIDLFRQAVQRRLHPESLLGLSGGRDSRHILLELHRQGFLPSAVFTVDSPGRAAETRIAESIALSVGVQYEKLHRNHRERIAEEEWKNLHSDLMSLEHYWIVPLAKRASGRVCWDGIGGDVLSEGLFLETWNLKLFEQNRLDELAEALVPAQRVAWSLDQSLFPREPVVAQIREELARHVDAANPIGSFYFWNRTRVGIAACAFGLFKQTIAPYLDTDLWRFLSSLPAHLLLDHRFHTDTIERAYPEFSAIPYWKKIELDDSAPSVVRSLMRYTLRHGAFPDFARCARALLHRQPEIAGWLLPVVVWREMVEDVFKRHGGTAYK